MVSHRFQICDSMNERSEANKRTEEIQKTGTGSQDEMDATASEHDNADESGAKSALHPWDAPSRGEKQILSLTLLKY